MRAACSSLAASAVTLTKDRRAERITEPRYRAKQNVK
jgi:hypothetical protein